MELRGAGVDESPLVYAGDIPAAGQTTADAARCFLDSIDAAQAAAHITLAEDDGATQSAQVLLYGPDDYARVSFLQSTTERQAIEHDLPIVAKETS